MQSQDIITTGIGAAGGTWSSTAPQRPGIEQVLGYDNLRQAWKRVHRNKGIAGADGQAIEEFAKHATANLESLRSEVLQGHYSPQPLRWFTIPKTDGSARTLAIPSVRDRVLQAAVVRA